jgi:hypothetical protein
VAVQRENRAGRCGGRVAHAWGGSVDRRGPVVHRAAGRGTVQAGGRTPARGPRAAGCRGRAARVPGRGRRSSVAAHRQRTSARGVEDVGVRADRSRRSANRRLWRGRARTRRPPATRLATCRASAASSVHRREHRDRRRHAARRCHRTDGRCAGRRGRDRTGNRSRTARRRRRCRPAGSHRHSQRWWLRSSVRPGPADGCSSTPRPHQPPNAMDSTRWTSAPRLRNCSSKRTYPRSM